MLTIAQPWGHLAESPLITWRWLGELKWQAIKHAYNSKRSQLLSDGRVWVIELASATRASQRATFHYTHLLDHPLMLLTLLSSIRWRSFQRMISWIAHSAHIIHRISRTARNRCKLPVDCKSPPHHTYWPHSFEILAKIFTWGVFTQQ